MLRASDVAIGVECYLRSGSPQMVVRGIGSVPEDSDQEIGLVQCVWMVDGIVHTADFPFQCLTTVFPGHTPTPQHLHF